MKKSYRSVFISDLHLGSKGCNIELLDNFLSNIRCENLYLVGDIIDGWALSRGKSYFPQSHVNVIRKVLSKAKKDTNIFYVIGNHDEFLRKYADFLSHVDFGNIRIADEFIHTTVDGKKLWVIHGDMYDGITLYHKWLSKLGDVSYIFLLFLNRHFNRIIRKLGGKYWSLSAFIKHKVKGAVDFIYGFESAISRECRLKSYNGVICGHIHHAEIKHIDGITYHNCGDFVESCTALVEHETGEIELIRWHKIIDEDINHN
jgi:UDP-2,3-diacylglucosamine pyrophosphatase LpxH